MYSLKRYNGFPSATPGVKKPSKFNIDDGTMESMENASTSTESEQNNATTTEDQMEYDAGCPFILEVKYNDGTEGI